MKVERDHSSSSFFHTLFTAAVVVLTMTAAFYSFREYVFRNDPDSGIGARLASLTPIKVAEVEEVGSIYYRDVYGFLKEYPDLTYDKALTLAAIEETLIGFSDELQDFEVVDFVEGRGKMEELSNLWMSVKSAEQPMSYDYDSRFKEIKTLEHFIQDIGIDFASVARQYSELDSAYLGGYLGEIKREDLPDSVLEDFYDSDEDYSGVLAGKEYFYLAKKGYEGDEGIDFYLIGIRRAEIEEYVKAYAKTHHVIIY